LKEDDGKTTIIGETHFFVVVLVLTYVPSDFWDTAGQEAFSRMHPSYYYRAHCCILVFDVTRKITYQHLADWYKELRDHCENIPCVLVANKIDVDYNVRDFLLL
jgi:small GTP-binding protein